MLVSKRTYKNNLKERSATIVAKKIRILMKNTVCRTTAIIFFYKYTVNF